MRGGSSPDVLRHLRTLYRCGVVGPLSDEELLERFLAHRDEMAEEAFAELVQRHGPMVLVRLPPSPGRCARGRRRLPGDLPGPGPKGDFGGPAGEGRQLALRGRRPHGQGVPRPRLRVGDRGRNG